MYSVDTSCFVFGKYSNTCSSDMTNQYERIPGDSVMAVASHALNKFTVELNDTLQDVYDEYTKQTHETILHAF